MMVDELNLPEVLAISSCNVRYQSTTDPKEMRVPVQELRLAVVRLSYYDKNRGSALTGHYLDLLVAAKTEKGR